MTKLSIQVAFSGAVLALTGCASTSEIPLPPGATSLTLHVHNDFKTTMLMRGAIATSYANEQCERPATLGTKLFMKDHDALPPVAIAAGKPYTFGIRTNDAGVVSRNTGCTVTATFTPVESEAYRVLLSTSDDKTCTVVIANAKNESVPFTMPEYSCDLTPSGIVRNGTGYYKNPTIGPVVY